MGGTLATNGLGQISAWYETPKHDFNKDNAYYMQVIQNAWQGCASNSHVFKCDHAETCKCGKATRKIEPPSCKECGKQL